MSNVRVVVMGDAGTGKSSLIVSVATDSFPHKVAPLIPPTRLPHDFFPDRVPITIIDTSSRPEDKGNLEMECKKADAIVLTYACDRPQTLHRLSTFWLPELRRFGVNVPVIVVGCKLDLRSDQQPSLEEMMTPIMHEFREIETCIECSALKQIQVAEVFYYAQKAVLHPTAPLFDQETQTLKPRCVRALKRIFILCDHDRDGALSDSELNEFQVKCFNAPLQPSEVVSVKKVVAEKLPEGVNENGLTLTGFLFLHALFIERGRLETTWTVLRKFGYDNEIKLRDDLLQNPSFKRAPDQSVELTDKGVDFLKDAFLAFDADGDGALRPQEIDELFSTAPNSSDESSWKQAAELLLAVATHGENNGYEVPCLLIASKDDLGPNAATISDSARVCQDMGVEAPISVSIKLGDVGNVFRRIVDAAQRPHLSIPVTEAGKNYQQYCRLVNRSLVFLSVGAAVVVVGIGAYRAYSLRRQSHN